MKHALWLALCVAAVGMAGEGAKDEPVVPTEKTALFNGEDFAGWVKFVPDKKVDVDKLWTVRDGVVHCLGKPNGYIRTEKTYANYKLHFEWRWVAKPTNSGCLLHMSGRDRVWPTCIEAQLMHKNAGDFWLLSRSTLKVDGETRGPAGYVNVKKKHPSNEKEPGEWNEYDILCDGGTVKVWVNGLLQNAGTEAHPSSGHICLQSEGSPIEFRNITLEPVPAEAK
ncbi:MAG: DUF1080 domain-containing protein [Candidatus Brocadiia bacterium]